MLTLIAVVLLVIVIAGAPPLGWNTSFGYAPSGVALVLLLVVLYLLFKGRT